MYRQKGVEVKKIFGEYSNGDFHVPLPVETLHAAQELQASEEDVAEVIVNTKLNLNFAKLN